MALVKHAVQILSIVTLLVSICKTLGYFIVSCRLSPQKHWVIIKLTVKFLPLQSTTHTSKISYLIPLKSVSLVTGGFSLLTYVRGYYRAVLFYLQFNNIFWQYINAIPGGLVSDCLFYPQRCSLSVFGLISSRLHCVLCYRFILISPKRSAPDKGTIRSRNSPDRLLKEIYIFIPYHVLFLHLIIH